MEKGSAVTRWLQIGGQALASSDLIKAGQAANQAEMSLPPIDEDAPAEGQAMRARLSLLRCEVELQRWELDAAEKQLNHAFAALGNDPEHLAELWRLTARLAERRGHWAGARAAWMRMERHLAPSDVQRRLDCRIRSAEAAQHAGTHEEAEAEIQAIEGDPAVRMDAVLRTRASLLRATMLERNGDREGALRRYSAILSQADQPAELRCMVRLRTARALCGRSPWNALRQLHEAYDHLSTARHPDAYGLVLSQLAGIALLLGRPAIAALAAHQADLRRGLADGDSWVILREALVQLGHDELVDGLDEEQSPAVDPAVRAILAEQSSSLGFRAEDRTDHAFACVMGGLLKSTPQAVAAMHLPLVSPTWDTEDRLEMTLDPEDCAPEPSGSPPVGRRSPLRLEAPRSLVARAVVALLCFGAGFASMTVMGVLTL